MWSNRRLRLIGIACLAAVAGWLGVLWLSVAPTYAVTYQLTWDASGVTYADDTTSWQVTTNLGYLVTVETGYLNTARMELVACDDAATSAAAPWAASVAYAGHGDTVVDDSRWTGPLVESLTVTARQQLDTVATTHTAYCDAHYLVAQATDASIGLPTDGTLDDLTLYVSGTYVSPAGGDPVPFEVATLLAWGSFQALDADTTLPANAVITLERQLATLFDDIAFDTATDTDLAMTILRNATQNISLSVDDA